MTLRVHGGSGCVGGGAGNRKSQVDKLLNSTEPSELKFRTKSRFILIGKDSDAGRDWGQEEKGTTDEMAGWHHRLFGRGFE